MRKMLLILLGIVFLLFAAQPDNMIRIPILVDWMGDGVYNDVGVQTIGWSIGQTDTVVYYIKIENDGPGVDNFTVRGNPGDASWTVLYYDALEVGNDITDSITGPTGYIISSLAEGDSVRIRLEMISGPLTTGEKSVKVWSVSTDALTDTVMARTTVIAPQPDNMIKNWDEIEYIGGGVFNTDGTDQTKFQLVDLGDTAVYHIKVMNIVTFADSFKVFGNPGDVSWNVRYYDEIVGGNDITGTITTSGWSTGPLDMGDSVRIRLEVMPESTATDSFEILVLTVSLSDTSKRDAVKALTKVKEAPPPPSYQPDLSIKNPSDTGYTGDGIYNIDGTNQTREQTVYSESTAVYHIRIENDGEKQDSFRLKGPSSIATWEIKYFDSLSGGNEITANIITTGWVVVVDSAAHKEIRLEITPLNPDAGTKDVLLLVTSLSDTSKKDAVKAITSTKIEEGIVETEKSKTYELKILPSSAYYEIFYSLPVKEKLDIRVFDAIGKEMKVLKRDIEEPGGKIIFWDKSDNRNRKVSSGIYFVRFATPDYTAVRKLILVK